MTTLPTVQPGERLWAVLAPLARRFGVAERADLECCGLTIAQAATLEYLECCGPIRLGDLARHLGIQPSTLTRNVERLIRDELVEKRPDPEDGRASRLHLTGAGRAAAGRTRSASIAFADRIAAELPAETVGRLLTDLPRLLAAVRRATADCCPGAFETDLRQARSTRKGENR